MNKQKEKGIFFLASSIVSITAIILASFAIFGEFEVETNVLALFGIALIPWLIPSIKSVKLLGSVEVETLKEEVDDF